MDRKPGGRSVPCLNEIEARNVGYRSFNRSRIMAQNQNFGASINVLDAVSLAVQGWTRPWGLLISLALEATFYLLFSVKLGLENSSVLHKLILLGLVFLSTIVLWLFSSKRILFRSVTLVVLLLIMAITITLLFCYKLYPAYFDSRLSFIPYSQYVSSIILFLVTIILGMVLIKYLPNGKKLFVVFAVANGSVSLESKLKGPIRSALNDIEEEVDSVRLELLPFGIITSASGAEHFIKRTLTDADAIVFANVIEETEGNHVEYLFDKFSSRINEHRFPDVEIKNRIDQGVVETHKRSKTWNYINAANDNCSRTKVILENLKGMLQMYVGGILLMQHRFKDAMPFMEMSLVREKGNIDTYALASQLYTYAVLSAVKELETDQRDYDSAFAMLEHCAARIPASLSHPGYNMAMARAMFYKGDMKASYEYTKKFKDYEWQEWNYELNMGFYAIYRKCVPEFVRRYKRLLKFNTQEGEVVDFAIDFLDHQAKLSNDKRYKVLLSVAMAFLHIYRKRSKAKVMISKIDYSAFPAGDIKELDKLKTIIFSSKETLQVVGKRSQK